MAKRLYVSVPSMSFVTDETTNKPGMIDDASADTWPGEAEPSKLLEAGLTINKYAAPITLPVGLVGNILILILMHRPFMKTSTSAVYFKILAVGDSLHLLMHFTGPWMSKHNDKDLWGYYDITCKMQMILMTTGFTWPAWIIVAMTAERLVAVCFPFRAKKWLTVKMAGVVCVAITLLSFVLWSAVYLPYGVSTGPCDRKLLKEITEEYTILLAAILYTYVPTPLLIIMNTVIVWQLIRARKQRDKMTATIGSTNSKVSRVTVMAVTVSLVYLVLTLPSSFITNLDIMGIDTGKLVEMLRGDQIKFCRQVFNVLRELNHAINFLLYLLILPKVRNELVKMWRIVTATACLSAKPGGKGKADEISSSAWSTRKTEQ